MDEFLRGYVMKGFIDAVGKEADHFIRLKSAEWHGKGVLTDEDLEELNRRIEAKNSACVSEEGGDES